MYFYCCLDRIRWQYLLCKSFPTCRVPVMTTEMNVYIFSSWQICGYDVLSCYILDNLQFVNKRLSCLETWCWVCFLSAVIFHGNEWMLVVYDYNFFFFFFLRSIFRANISFLIFSPKIEYIAKSYLVIILLMASM